MNCPRCRKAVPEGSVFCPYCGASVTKAPKAAEPSPAPRRVKVRSVVKWTVLGLVLLAILWRTIACIHEQMVSEEDLDSMVRSIQGGAEEIIELMDPIMADVRDGEPMDLSGYAGYAQVRAYPKGAPTDPVEVVCSMDVTIEAAAGKVTLMIAPEVSS